MPTELSALTVFSDTPVPKGATSVLTSTIVDENGAVVPAASLTTLTLTLYNLENGAIINSRNAQNVLNANGVTVTSGGIMTWSMTALDNIIVDSTTQFRNAENKAVERHIALFEWTWATGTKAGSHEFEIHVLNTKYG